MGSTHEITDPKVIAREAREWLIRLDGDEEPSAEEKASLRAWTERSDAHREELARISQFWDEASVLTELSIPLQNEAQNQRGQSKVVAANWLKGFMGFQYAGVLSMVCVVGLVLFAFNTYNNTLNAASNGIYSTAVGELQTHTLADGSVLRINTDSQVEVNFNAEARSIRLLRGEAHFEVSHNKRWPFDVYAGIGRVKAVGTAFSVRLSDERVRVIVSEGRVDLAAPLDTVDQKPGELAAPAVLQSIGLLERRQTASFDNRMNAAEASSATPGTESRSLLNVNTLQEVELGRQLSWREGFLVFNAQPLSQVVAEVERYTPITIKILDEDLNALRIGGRFKIGEMDAMFDVFESSFGITVDRVDGKNVHLKK